MRSTSRKYILVVTLMLACINLSAQITSTFNANAEGWTTPNDADGTIAYSATGGNPGGFVFGTPFFFNLGAGTIYVPFYFVAPGTYLGNRSAYYNGTLQYDIQQSSTSAPNQYAEVIIANSLGITLYYFPTVPNQPAVAPTWTTFSVTLNNTLGFWKTTNSPTGLAATEAQVQNVLTSLADLELRGLYRDANTTNRLDNVSFRQPIVINTQPSSAATCTGPTLILTTLGTNNPTISYQWQRETSPAVWSDVTNTGGYSGATTASLSINTTGNFGAGNYRCLISGTAVNDAITNTAVITVNPLPTAPTTTGNAACGSSAVTLNAAGGTAGQFRWYTVPTGGTAIAGQTNNTYTTPVIAITTTYYVAINNGTCQSTRTPVIATINTPPAAPTATGNSACGSSAITLNAAGGSAGQYRWYSVPTGGTAIAGQTNNTYTTPVITITTTYYVAVNNGTCQGARTPVVATVNTPPAGPTATGNSACGSSAITLNAAGGTAGQYRWYTVPTGGAAIAGQTSNAYTTAVIAITTTYYVSINNGTCESTRTSVVATIDVVDATITQVDNTLTASTGSSYQWFLFGQPISQATNQTLEIDLYETAIYTVEVTEGNCTSLSGEFIYLITEIEKEKARIKLYPNPILEELTVEGLPNLSYTISIIDMLGRERIGVSNNGSSKQIISFKDLQSGSYILLLQSAQSKRYFKIVKQ
ncbi:MAG: laminin B domain-containing protein [Chryseolinea sp.]